MKISSFVVSTFFLLSSCSPGVTDRKKSTEPAPSGEIVVGQIDAFSGAQANFGIFSRSGIQLAIAKINGEGGIGGRPLRLVSIDDNGKPAQSQAAAEKLITEQKVVAILGATASSRTLAAAPVAQKYQVPLITPSSTNPSVTEVGDVIFRTCFIDTFQGEVMARFVVETLRVKNVAILQEEGSDYSLGLSRFFKDKFVSLGGKIVREETYREGDVEFRKQLTAIRSASPEVVYVPGYYTDVANIVAQARKMGIRAVFAGGDGWDSNELFKIGESKEPSYFTNHYAPNSPDPVHLKFVEAYKAKFRTPPNADAALGYDAAMVLFEAMRRAKSLSGPDLRAAIAATKNFPGVTGTISLDEKRNAVKSVVIFKTQGKTTEYIQTINP